MAENGGRGKQKRYSEITTVHETIYSFSRLHIIKNPSFLVCLFVTNWAVLEVFWTFLMTNMSALDCNQGFLLRIWIPCLCPKFLNPIPLDVAKYGFSAIGRSSKVMNFHKIWRSWLKNCARHALFNFELPKGVAVSIFVPHPSNFGQIWIFDRQTNDVLWFFLYL